MPRLTRLMSAVVLALVATSFAGGAGVVLAAVSLPIYRVDVVVPDGVATAINEAGDIAGWQTVNGATRAFAHAAGNLTLLPTAVDRPLSVARDINDAGQAVGYAYKTTIDEPGDAMRWTLGTSGWTARDLGFLAGDLVSEATGLSDAGRIVGRSNPRSFLNEHGFVFTDASGMTALGPLNSSYVPYDIDEAGMTVGTGYSTAQRVDSTTGAMQNLGATATYGFSHAYALNDVGQVAGTLTSSSGNAQVVARYSDVTGWQVLGGIGGGSCSGCAQNVGWGINNSGTVVGTGWPRTGVSPAQRAVIYLDSYGTLLYVDDLLQAGGAWSIVGAFDINDSGQIAGYARNPVSGARAAVRLSPVGGMPVPSAPSGLTATAHAATTSGDQNRIDLRWLDNSANESAFEVQRRKVDQLGAPLTTYALLVTNSANMTSYPDTELALGAHYQYRVRAINLAGASAYSNSPTARAPTNAPETIPPTVRITNPLGLSTVSRIVTVRISATDNVAVTRVELLVDSNLIGACTLGTPPIYTCKWDTRKWSNGGWTIYARAWDKAGNLAVNAITVYVKNGRVR